MSYIQYAINFLFVSAVLLSFYSCSPNTRTDSRIIVNLPAAITSADLPDKANLSVTAQVGDGIPKVMETGNEKAEAVFAGVSNALHKITISIEYESADFPQTVQLAAAGKSLTLVTGDNSIIFNDNEFTYPDSDQDNSNNLDELVRGGNPFNANIFPWTGSKQYGVEKGYMYSEGVATDNQGNVIVTGYTNGDFDSHFLVGTEDTFIVKFNPYGIKLWSVQFGVANALTDVSDVAVDLNGNIFVVGSTDGNLDGTTQPLNGFWYAFITKTDSSGTVQWTHQLGAADGEAKAQGVVTDSDGNAYIAGYAEGDFDGNTQIGARDFFITMYNSDGIKQWSMQNGVDQNQTLTRDIDIFESAAGSFLYVSGYTEGNLDGKLLTGTRDAFVCKYDLTGTLQWTEMIGVPGFDTSGRDVTTDADGDVIMTGYTSGDLEGNRVTESGYWEVFTTKYDSSGNNHWLHQTGIEKQDTYPQSIASDTDGNVYSVGAAFGGFDGNSAKGDTDFFVLNYDASGNKQWSNQFGVTGSATTAHGVATDEIGNIFIAGETEGDYDGNTLTGFTDFIITKLDNRGVKQ